MVAGARNMQCIPSNPVMGKVGRSISYPSYPLPPFRLGNRASHAI